VKDLVRIYGAPWVGWVIARLDSQSLLADGPEPFTSPTVTVLGEGILAQRISALLGTPSSKRITGESVQSWVHVLARATLDQDRVLINSLHAAGTPHLLVSASQHHVSLGPFVVPGRTSCVMCTDLARKDLDPTWPVQVYQLSQVPCHPGPILVSWAAATVVSHLLAYARGRMPESVSTTVEMSLHTGRLTYRGWKQHPRCPHHRTRSSIESGQ
jgi:hypothetical protein